MKKCKWAGDVNDEYCKGCDGITMEVDGNSIPCTECAGYEASEDEVSEEITNNNFMPEPEEELPFEEEQIKSVEKNDKKQTKEEKTTNNTALEEKVKTDAKINRIVFNEITPVAITEAVKHPREIIESKVDAQKARRVLDRLVGYNLSPLLWAKVKNGLSAGRVQSVALRLICEREKEVEDFLPEEYWSLDANFTKGKSSFTAHLVKYAGENPELKSEDAVREII